ncbi:MAG: 50S ribosomal protein L16 [Candidatus Altiarchaeota archaeon]
MAKGLRPAKCYRWDSPAYTRTSDNPGDSFITGIPTPKLNTYDMGNSKGDFNVKLSIIPKGRIIIRHNSLDAARISAQRILEKVIGVSNYYFKINVFPHHVIRENVMATGAGADRVQDGMRKSFGKPMGRAARIYPGQPIMTVYVNKDDQMIMSARKALRGAMHKLPANMRIEVSDIKK